MITELDAHTCQVALHARMAMAFHAARDRHLPGAFDSWESGGGFANRATAPGLQFLTTLVLTGSPSLEDVQRALADRRWEGIVPAIVLYEEPAPAVADFLRDAGFAPGSTRPVAIRHLHRGPEPEIPVDSPGTLRATPVADDEMDEFLAVLLLAYQVEGVLGEFIAAEHRSPQVLRFAVRDGDRTIAVAGMTLHEGVAVLGGAATLPVARGRGAQAQLLDRRLAIARAAGCTLAVATAAAGSVSARNLGRAGFTVHNRPSRHTSG